MLVKQAQIETLELTVAPINLKWFDKRAEPGDADCICSFCRQHIPVGEIIVQLWPPGVEVLPVHARLCEQCTVKLRVAEWPR